MERRFILNGQDIKRFVVLPEWMKCPSVMKPVDIWEMDYSKEIEFVPSNVHKVELHVEEWPCWKEPSEDQPQIKKFKWMMMM